MWKFNGKARKETKPNDFSLSWWVENKFPNLEFLSSKFNGHVETTNLGMELEEELFLGNRMDSLMLEFPAEVMEVRQCWKEAVYYSSSLSDKLERKERNRKAL